MIPKLYDPQELKNYVARIASGDEDGQWVYEDIPLLGQAVIYEDMESAIILLDNGADIHEADPSGHRPLSHARTKEWIAFLIKRGANPNSINPNTGYSLLHEAAYYGKSEVIGALVESGADMYSQFTLYGKNTPPSIAYTPPFAGMKLSPLIFVKILEAFKCCGYNIDGMEGDYSLLHGCVFTLNPVATAWLVDNGANTKIKDSSGRDPLEYLNHLLDNQKEWMFIGYDDASREQMEGLLEMGSTFYESFGQCENIFDVNGS